MQLVRLTDGRYGAIRDDRFHPFEHPATLGDLLASPDPAAVAADALARSPNGERLADLKLAPPVDEQEVWAAGVTYKRSKIAREEESVGAAAFYDKVYSASRPELFLKAPAWRVVGPGDAVAIRRDGKWNVPEPELALVISPRGDIVGYTIGNDMSSRDIEGENPLYLPQAKVYDRSCSLGPVVTLAASMPALASVGIRLEIDRDGKRAFDGVTDLGQMKRTPVELVGWLFRQTSFPKGAVLLTGTGIVPPDDFTLAIGDIVRIHIDGIGTLENPVG